MSFPPSNLIQFPARAEPPEYPNLPPPAPPPPGPPHQWETSVLSPYLGELAWGGDESQYLYPWEVRAATPDQFPEVPSVDKFPFKGEMPPSYYEIEPPQQESAQLVLSLTGITILLPMWERPLAVYQPELDEPLYTESYLELAMSVYPADPAAQLRPWQTPFDDPMPAAEDTACWHEYAKLDLDTSQRAEFVFVAAYWQLWDLPAPLYEIEAAAQEAATALLAPFYVGLAEFVFVVDYERPFALPEWPVDDASALAFVSHVVQPPSGPAVVLFVTPMLEGGIGFSRF